MEKRQDPGFLAVSGLALFLAGMWIEFGVTYVVMFAGFSMMFVDRRPT